MQAVYWFTGKHFLQLVELIIIDKRRSSKRGIIIIREIIIIRDGNINPGLLCVSTSQKNAIKNTLQRCLFHLDNLILLHQILKIIVTDIGNIRLGILKNARKNQSCPRQVTIMWVITKVILQFHIRKLNSWWKWLAYFQCCAVRLIFFHVMQVVL